METKNVSIGCLLLLCVVATVSEACKYSAKINKAVPCKNNNNPLITLTKNVGVKFTPDDCKVKIDGCGHFNNDVKIMNATIKAFKNGIPMITVTKEACGFKDGKFEIKCPIAKNTDICPGDNIFSIPGGPKVLDLLLGKVGAKVDLITDKGTFCYEGEGVIAKQ